MSLVRIVARKTEEFDHASVTITKLPDESLFVGGALTIVVDPKKNTQRDGRGIPVQSTTTDDIKLTITAKGEVLLNDNLITADKLRAAGISGTTIDLLKQSRDKITDRQSMNDLPLPEIRSFTKMAMRLGGVDETLGDIVKPAPVVAAATPAAPPRQEFVKDPPLPRDTSPVKFNVDIDKPPMTHEQMEARSVAPRTAPAASAPPVAPPQPPKRLQVDGEAKAQVAAVVTTPQAAPPAPAPVVAAASAPAPAAPAASTPAAPAPAPVKPAPVVPPQAERHGPGDGDKPAPMVNPKALEASYEQGAKAALQKTDISGIKLFQQACVLAGMDMGKTGKDKNGIDGDPGQKTTAAFAKACQEVGVDPAKINLSGPANKETEALMKHMGEKILIHQRDTEISKQQQRETAVRQSAGDHGNEHRRVSENPNANLPDVRTADARAGARGGR